MRRTRASRTFAIPTPMLPIMKTSAIRTLPTVPEDLDVCHNLASLALPRKGLPTDLLEDREVRLEDRREEVGRCIRIARRPRDQSILQEEIQMVPDCPVVETEALGELVGVVRPLLQGLEDPRTVRSPSCAREQVPQELSKGCAHVASSWERDCEINRMPSGEKGERSAPSTRGGGGTRSTGSARRFPGGPGTRGTTGPRRS